MGWGYILEEAVSSAQSDMARVAAAAESIGQAIAAAAPWLEQGTWQGAAATAWFGQWEAFYRGVRGCLASLPSAEASVVAQVRRQMEQLAVERARARATG